MGMSTHITAFRDQNGKLKEMLEIKDFCDSKGVSYPAEVNEYFGSEANERSKYLRESMSELSVKDWVKPWNDDMQEGYEVNVKDIPAEVSIIRFYNSW